MREAECRLSDYPRIRAPTIPREKLWPAGIDSAALRSIPGGSREQDGSGMDVKPDEDEVKYHITEKGELSHPNAES